MASRANLAPHEGARAHRMYTLALVGRPNVGKSALFNRMAESRTALVRDEPGVTRDRLYAETDWNGFHFRIVDTGGLWEAEPEDQMPAYMRRQTLMAVQEADVVALVVDARADLSAADEAVADLLRKSSKPVLLVANKAQGRVDLTDLYRLGLGDPLPVSATHGLNVGDLLDMVVERFPGPPDGSEAAAAPMIRVAIAGRPNVGKSSLLNRLVGEERTLVTPIAGTTRDVVNVQLDTPAGRLELLDTAGLRRPARIRAELESKTVLRTLAAIREADLVLMMVSAEEPASQQDLRIASQVVRHHRAAVLVLNKADLVPSTRALLPTLHEAFDFMPYAAVVPLSVKTGWGMERLWEPITTAYANFGRRVSTGAVNRLLRETVAVVPPPTSHGRPVKLYYGTQVGTRPPHFVFFANDPDLVHFSYRRHLERRIRERWDFTGSPVRLSFRPRRSQQGPEA